MTELKRPKAEDYGLKPWPNGGVIWKKEVDALSFFCASDAYERQCKDIYREALEQIGCVSPGSKSNPQPNCKCTVCAALSTVKRSETLTAEQPPPEEWRALQETTVSRALRDEEYKGFIRAAELLEQYGPEAVWELADQHRSELETPLARPPHETATAPVKQ
jgi:hypothetical protein